jgi:hypothetical protein
MQFPAFADSFEQNDVAFDSARSPWRNSNPNEIFSATKPQGQEGNRVFCAILRKKRRKAKKTIAGATA